MVSDNQNQGFVFQVTLSSNWTEKQPESLGIWESFRYIASTGTIEEEWSKWQKSV